MEGLAKLFDNAAGYIEATGGKLQDKLQIKKPRPAKQKKNVSTYGFAVPENAKGDNVFGGGMKIPLAEGLALMGKGVQVDINNMSKLGDDRWREGKFGAQYDFGPGKISGTHNVGQFNYYDPNTSKELGLSLDDIGAIAVEQSDKNPKDVEYSAKTKIPLESLAAILSLEGSYNRFKKEPEFKMNFTKKF